MQRLKIFAGTSIVLIALLMLTISVSMPFSGSEKTNPIDRSKKELADLEGVMLYQRRQQELHIAVKAYFDKAIASGDIVGAGVSIVKGDSIVISEGFGKRNIDTHQAVDGQTIFRLGSLSKGFAAVLAVNIVNEGKLHWDDKVIDHIPGFQLGDSENTNKITLANLLSHTTGAPYHSFTNLIEGGLPLSDIAERFKEVRPIGIPGAIYSYQNALFALSGEMISNATGEKIAKSMEDRFFNPLGMCSASMDYESLEHAENIALPHSKWQNGWRSKKLNDHYFNAIAAGGISASAMDMGKWMRFILGHNPEIMNSSSLEKAFSPVIEIKGRSKYYQRWPGHHSSHYGLGWRIHKYVDEGSDQEKTIWHHGGSINSYRNEIAVYPDADIGICVLFNNHSRLAKTVVPDLYKIMQRVYQMTATDIASRNIPETDPHF